MSDNLIIKMEASESNRVSNKNNKGPASGTYSDKKSSHDQKLSALEERTSILEEGMEVYDERLNGFRHEIKILLTQINIMNDWIKTQFGVELINKESPHFIYVNQDSEELEVVRESLISKKKQPVSNKHLQTQVNKLGTSITSMPHRQEELILQNSGLKLCVKRCARGQETSTDQTLGQISKNPSTKGSKETVATSEVVVGIGSSSDEYEEDEDQLSGGSVTSGRSSSSSKLQNNTKELNQSQQTSTFKMPCVYCQKIFLNRARLKLHLKICKFAQPFKCEQCQKEFTYSSSYRRHLLRHTGVKRYICQHCQKGFYENSALQEHMVIHTGDKLFSCNACGGSFTRKRTVKEHRCPGRQDEDGTTNKDTRFETIENAEIITPYTI